MATLSVPTNTSTQIVIQTSDYSSSPAGGDKYSFYSAAFAASHSNQLGEAGLGEWYHGAAGFSSTTSTNATSTQVGAGWDSSNGLGGLCNYSDESGNACTGTGSAFVVADTTNTCMQRVHVSGASASYTAQRYWTIWANGAHVVAIKNRAALSTAIATPSTAVHSTPAPTENFPSANQLRWGFSGTHVGVIVCFNLTGGTGKTGTGSASDGQAVIWVDGAPSATIAAGTIVNARLLLNGYDGASGVTNTVITAFAGDYVTHGGGSNTLTVTTGTKTTSGTDLYGNTGTTWTDGYDPQRGAYIIAASSNHINIGGSTATQWGVDGTTVTKRFRPCFIVTGWTDTTNPPTVTLGGSAQTKGTDFESWIDTGNQVLYLCLLKDLAGTEGALDVTAPAVLVSVTGAAGAAGTLNAQVTLSPVGAAGAAGTLTPFVTLSVTGGAGGAGTLSGTLTLLATGGAGAAGRLVPALVLSATGGAGAAGTLTAALLASATGQAGAAGTLAGTLTLLVTGGAGMHGMSSIQVGPASLVGQAGMAGTISGIGILATARGGAGAAGKTVLVIITPVVPPSMEPGAAPLVALWLNETWVPVVLGGVKEYYWTKDWDELDATEQALVQAQVLDLLDNLGIAGQMTYTGPVPVSTGDGLSRFVQAYPGGPFVLNKES